MREAVDVHPLGLFPEHGLIVDVVTLEREARVAWFDRGRIVAAFLSHRSCAAFLTMRVFAQQRPQSPAERNAAANAAATTLARVAATQKHDLRARPRRTSLEVRRPILRAAPLAARRFHSSPAFACAVVAVADVWACMTSPRCHTSQ
jgi:hypothetical protein